MKTTRKTALLSLILIMLFAAPIMLTAQVHATTTTPPLYDLTGTWQFNDISGDISYPHTMTISSFNPNTGEFSGTGYYNPGPYTWNITGTETGNQITFHLIVTSTDEYGVTLDGTGTASNSTYMSGTGTQSNVEGQVCWTATRESQPKDQILPGTGVAVYPVPNFGLTFDQVNAPGLAIVDVSTTPPEGFPPLPGIIGPYYDVQVTALFTGKVLVCIKYDDSGLSSCQEKRLRLCASDGLYPIGDVNRDGRVDLKDIIAITVAIGSKLGTPRWNLACDLNGDLKIDTKDLCIAIKNLGQSSWVDITTSIDTASNIICGVTGRFSVFGLH